MPPHTKTRDKFPIRVTTFVEYRNFLLNKGKVAKNPPKGKRNRGLTIKVPGQLRIPVERDIKVELGNDTSSPITTQKGKRAPPKQQPSVNHLQSPMLWDESFLQLDNLARIFAFDCCKLDQDFPGHLCQCDILESPQRRERAKAIISRLDTLKIEWQSFIEVERPATETDYVGCIAANLNSTTAADLCQWLCKVWQPFNTTEPFIGVNTEILPYTADVYSPIYDLTHEFVGSPSAGMTSPGFEYPLAGHSGPLMGNSELGYFVEGPRDSAIGSPEFGHFFESPISDSTTSSPELEGFFSENQPWILG